MMHDRTPKNSLSNESGQNLVPEGIKLDAPTPEPYKRILTPKALAFLSKLELKFRNRIHELLQARTARQARINAGELPDFLPETKDIREGDWKAAPLPEELLCRKVEITGPTERKMMINALNSGANGFMADLEDSNSPGWANMVEGQLNLYDAIRGTITFTSPEGKEYRLTGNPAVLFVRPRGLHLPERHVLIEGRPMSGSLFDLGLFCSTTAGSSLIAERAHTSIFQKRKATLRQGSGTTCSRSPRRSLACQKASSRPPSF